jgi:hypothetical protein
VLEVAEAKSDPIARFVLARILSQTAAHSHLQWDSLVDGGPGACLPAWLACVVQPRVSAKRLAIQTGCWLPGCCCPHGLVMELILSPAFKAHRQFSNY